MSGIQSMTCAPELARLVNLFWRSILSTSYESRGMRLTNRSKSMEDGVRTVTS